MLYGGRGGAWSSFTLACLLGWMGRAGSVDRGVVRRNLLRRFVVIQSPIYARPSSEKDTILRGGGGAGGGG